MSGQFYAHSLFLLLFCPFEYCIIKQDKQWQWIINKILFYDATNSRVRACARIHACVFI